MITCFFFLTSINLNEFKVNVGYENQIKSDVNYFSPIKSEFILAKHLRLAYVLKARRDEPPSELGRQLHSAVRSSSLDTAMRLLVQGADPNFYYPVCLQKKLKILYLQSVNIDKENMTVTK